MAGSWTAPPEASSIAGLPCGRHSPHVSSPPRPRPYLAEAALPDGTQDLEVVQVHCRESRGAPGEGAAGQVPARAPGPSSLPRAPMLQGAPQHHREPPTLQGVPDTLGSPPQCREPPNAAWSL